jgi:single-stranded DNA-binding protein
MGHAGKDWEFRVLPTGTQVLSGSLAISKGNDRGTVWVQCKVWGKYAEVIEGRGGVRKGNLVLVRGRWDQNKGKDGKVFESLNVDELTNFTTRYSCLGKRGHGAGPEDYYPDGGGEDEVDIPF